MRRIGFEAAARINRHDFGVSWQDDLPGGGVVVSNEIELFLDVEAILLDDLEATGAIGYYRRSVERSQTDRYLVRALGGVESDGNGDLDRPGRLGGRVRDGQRYEARPIESRAARLGQHGWIEDFAERQIKGIGALELLAAVGLIVPAAFDIAPVLTALAASGVVMLMLGAGATHLRRGELQMLPVNLVLAGLALFVAIERFGPQSL